ncbi:MAG: hypothetical protein ACRDFZ_05725 [Candidatus Limnocylindria bacterium]
MTVGTDEAVLARLDALIARVTAIGREDHAQAQAYVAQAGEELAVVSRTLGHADLSTTADVYAHLTPTMLERSAARMESILVPDSAEAVGG